MKKRFLSILMALSLALSLLPTAAFAEGEVTETPGEEMLPEVTTGETVATVNGTAAYTSLADAVQNATSGDTIQLQENTDISGTGLTIPADKSLTLDLNGKEIKAANNGSFVVLGSLTVSDTSARTGRIYSETQYGSGYTSGIILVNGENALLTLTGGSIESAFENAAANGQFGVAVWDGGDFTMTGGKIEAGWYAISGNGNNSTQNSVINISGGELISTADFAVYLPQSGTTNITGGTIYGEAGGISIQRGTLNISDEALITSKGTGDTGDWGDGTGGQDAAAVNIAAEYGDCTVNISGGKLTAEENALFIKADSKYDIDFSITGGTFSSDVSDYVANGYKCDVDADGNYTVTEIGDSEMVIDGGYDETSGSVTGSLDGTFVPGGSVTDKTDEDVGNQGGIVDNSVTVDLTTTNEGTSAKTTTLNVTKDTANSLGEASSLTVQTDAGSVKFDSDALGKVAGATEDVTIKVTKNTDASVLASYTVTAQAGTTNLLPYGGSNNGTVTITVTKPEGTFTDLQAWYVTGSGDQIQYVEPLPMPEGLQGENTVTFQIKHLSTIVLRNGNPPAGSTTVAQVISGGVVQGTYTDLQDAIDAAEAGDTVQLLGNVVVTVPEGTEANGAAIVIDEAITLDGQGLYSITADKESFDTYQPWTSSQTYTGKYHMINVTTGGVTLQNLTLNGGWDGTPLTGSSNAAKSGINVWNAGSGIELNNVTVQGCSVYGVVVNGSSSEVTATNLNVDNTNQWGVNVDNGGTINVVDGTIEKDFVVENSKNSGTGKATISGGTFNGEVKTQGSNVDEDALTITGGEFKKQVTAPEGSENTISISGGTFNNDVSKYLEDGLELSEGDSGTIVPAGDTVATVTDANGVTKGYTSLPDAITAANASANAVVTLRKNAELTTTQNITQTMTIDLGGNQIDAYNVRAFQVQSGTLTLTGYGTVRSFGDNLVETSSVIRVGDNAGNNASAGLIIDKDVIIRAPGTYGVTVFGSGTVETVTIRGTVTATGNAPAVSGNGLYDGTNITIESPANISATCGVAVYQPQDGTLTITGGTITGGIEAKSGTINISGSPTITAVGTPSHVTNDGGPSTAGYAIAVVDNKGYGNGAKVTITEGTYIGEIAYLKDGDGVSSGSDAGDIAVSGGSFDRVVPQEYCADDFVPVATPNDDGMYTVVEKEISGSTVTYLTLSPRTLSLTVGNTAQLTAEAKYSNNTSAPVTWSSSNSAVAAVNNGVVTANSAGTATITVEAGDLTLTCAVTVSGSPSSGNGGGSSEPSYSPVIDITGNGDVKVSPRTPSEGDEVTITPDPDNGYEVGSVTVTDRSGRTVRVTENRDGTYTFTQPAGRVTIEVTFVRTGESTFFTDVPETFWAYDEIAWAYENGYVNGVTATTFNPNGAISRQQVWMILARLSGYDPADMAAARAWAMENGVSDGTNPGNAVTRQQLVALLFRFAELRNHANDQRADLSVYPDAGTVAEYAVEPMQWSVANDIVGGTTAGTLNPEGTATRAQFAVILYRFWTNV